MPCARKAASPIGTGVKRESEPELVRRAQHAERCGRDLRPDAVAFHDDKMGHDAGAFLSSAVRAPAAIVKKPMSVWVVTKRMAWPAAPARR